MKITQEQGDLLAKFRSERISMVDRSVVMSIKGAVIGGQESGLAKLFKGVQNSIEDKNDIVASYVVMSPWNVVLGFYSLRCGELYRQVDLQKMELCANAWEALTTLRDKPAMNVANQQLHLEAIQKAMLAGFTSPDEWKRFYLKKSLYIRDKKDWSGSNIEQVSEVVPGIELKYFGINEDAKRLWASCGLPRRIGETLFWQCVVDKIDEIRKRVGCQYLYLFAADNKPDGNLVVYYNTRLHFEKDFDLNANKPHFDFKCRFMCQEIKALKQNQEYFFDHFNSTEK